MPVNAISQWADWRGVFGDPELLDVTAPLVIRPHPNNAPRGSVAFLTRSALYLSWLDRPDALYHHLWRGSDAQG